MGGGKPKVAGRPIACIDHAGGSEGGLRLLEVLRNRKLQNQQTNLRTAAETQADFQKLQFID